jgi:hypothetical protein
MSEPVDATDGEDVDPRSHRTMDLFGGAGLLYLLSQILSAPTAMNWDCSALLFGGQMLLEGKVPYVDFYELNPPLVIYLQVIPVFLNRLIPIPLPLLFNLGVLGLATAAWWLIRTLLPRARTVSPTTASCVALAPVAISLTLFSQEHWYAGDFGQREHLFALLALPYLIVRWFRWEGWRVSSVEGALIGLATGVVACLKPFFLLAIALPEIAWYVRHRRFRPLLHADVLAAAAFAAAYAIHFFLLPQAMREAYFHRWVPLIVHGYGAYDVPLTSLLTFPGLLFALAASVAPGLIRPGQTSSAWRLTLPLALATLTGAMGFVIQHKGWEYHLLPAMTGALAIAFLMASELTALGRRSRVSPLGSLLGVGSLVVGFALTILAGALLLYRGAPAPSYTDFHRAIIKLSQPNERVLFIDTSTLPQHPTLMQVGRRPGSRYYGEVFTLPMLYAGVRARENEPFPYRRREQMPPEEARMLHDLVEDVHNLKPRLIFIPRGGRLALPDGFSIEHYLDRVGWNGDALQDYRLVGVVDDWMLWRRESVS